MSARHTWVETLGFLGLAGVSWFVGGAIVSTAWNIVIPRTFGLAPLTIGAGVLLVGFLRLIESTVAPKDDDRTLGQVARQTLSAWIVRALVLGLLYFVSLIVGG